MSSIWQFNYYDFLFNILYVCQILLAFRTYYPLKSIDTDNDGLLSPDEIADATYIDVCNKEISNLKECGDYTLIEDTDYTLSYENNVNAGTAKVIITAKGDFYAGEVEIEFTINKAEPTVNSTIDDADYTDGDDLPEIKLAENDTLGKIEWVSKIAKLVDGKISSTGNSLRTMKITMLLSEQW